MKRYLFVSGLGLVLVGVLVWNVRTMPTMGLSSALCHAVLGMAGLIVAVLFFACYCDTRGRVKAEKEKERQIGCRTCVWWQEDTPKYCKKRYWRSCVSFERR